MSGLPLEGIRVVEIGQIVAGPTAGLLLGDLGADVVKLEPPDAGRESRMGNMRNGSFYFFNRNKRGIVVNLSSAEGREIAMRLLKRADVLVENMAPGSMKRLGLGYEKVRAVNPRLIYCSLKGYLKGPYAARPLMDEPGQMASGLAFMTGPPGQPMRAGASVVDMGAATYAVLGVMAALMQREKTGKGQHVTGGLFESALFFVGQHMSTAQLTGEPSQPMRASRHSGTRKGTAIYDLFTCKDDKQVFIGIVSDGQWRRICPVFGMEDLAADPKYNHNPGRAERHDTLKKRISEVCARYTRDEIVDMLDAADVRVAPLHSPSTVLEEDKHVRSEGRMLPVQIGDVAGRLPPMPYESDAYSFSVRHSAPKEPGRDTVEILRELGYSTDDAQALATKGIVRGPGLPEKAA
jgi:crotonobetainyl-CoA:carnitine CoA-transferase CaiB-like acyl-CoA transferase